MNELPGKQKATEIRDSLKVPDSKERVLEVWGLRRKPQLSQGEPKDRG